MDKYALFTQNCTVTNYSDTAQGWINFTVNDSAPCVVGKDDVITTSRGGPPIASALDYILVTLFGLICLIGLIGNGLVIYVITCDKKMKSVTNYLILNLSVADSLFLVGIPMAMTTSILKHWIFGRILCKTYYILTCINQFTGAFTLTTMSADRFLAVCYPVPSMTIRTKKYVFIALLLIWTTSLLFITPIVLYTQLQGLEPYKSCTISWPGKGRYVGLISYTVYTLLLGFAIPVLIITILYVLLVMKLRQPGMVTQSQDARAKKRSQAVTKLVTVIISVFIICWLPHWTLQLYLIFTIPRQGLHPYVIYLFQASTVLSYANSMVNPIIYAFTNMNFREAFMGVFHCVSKRPSRDVTRATEYVSLVGNPAKRKQHGNGAAEGQGKTMMASSAEVANNENSATP